MSEILTQAFKNSLRPVGLLYAKPPPKKKKTMKDYAIASKERKLARKGHKKVKFKASKKKLPSIKSLKTKADKVFSLFIRNRDGNKCVLCGSTKNVQNGHLIKRGKMSVRYNTWNCHALCSQCNYRDNFEPWHYVNWFLSFYDNQGIGKHGQGNYEFLINKSKQLVKANREFFEEVIEKYEKNTKKA